MKRHVCALMLVAGLCTPGLSLAADASLEALAARRELQEFMRDTNTRLRNLEEALQAQQQRIIRLEDENRTLRQDLVKAMANRNDDNLDRAVQQLDNKIQDVDKRRLSDNKLTLEKLERLERLLNDRAAAAAKTPPPKATPDISSNADLFEYSIQSGDNLYKIASTLKAQGVNVSVDDIKNANPKVVWTKLKIGQKIIIPVPK